MSLAYPDTEHDLGGPSNHGGLPGPDHVHGHAPGRQDGCMFCTGGQNPERSLDGDGVALSQHLALNDDCRQQWKLWKAQIVDEWGGD